MAVQLHGLQTYKRSLKGANMRSDLYDTLEKQLQEIVDKQGPSKGIVAGIKNIPME